MGRRSTRTEKSIYQISRENASLTREEAGDRMDYVTQDRLEKIEAGRTGIRPEDVLEMSRCYDDPLLCNLHCATVCPIGKKKIERIEKKDLPVMSMNILKMINQLYEKKDKIIDVSAQGRLSDENLDELIEIGRDLVALTKDVESLKIWIRQEISRQQNTCKNFAE